MKGSDKRWLQARLDAWVAQDLIRRDQAEAIFKYQEQNPVKRVVTFFALLVGIGALSVGVGIILVVSYNWERIPSVIRQLAFLFLIMGLAETRLRLAGRTLVERGLDIVWVILPLAGIGLWGQMYQLSGDTFTPLGVTLFLALPIVWLGGHGGAATTHAFIFVWAMFTGVFESGSWISMGDLEPLRTLMTLAVCVSLWIALLYQTRLFASLGSVLALWVAFLVFLSSVLGVGGALEVGHGGVFFLIISALGMLFWTGRGPLGLDRRKSGDLGWAIAAALLYGLSFLHNDFGLGDDVNTPSLYYGLFLSGLAVAGLAYADVEDKAGVGGARGFKMLLGLPMALSALLVLTSQEVLVGYLGTVALLGFSLHAMHSGWLRADKRLINQGVGLIGLLMVTRFIDYFGSLLTSGSAFIVMGLLFLGVAYALNRGRRHLLEQVQEGSAA